MQILPFAVLLGGILAFWRLTRSSELVVARAAGVSAWRFLAAPVLVRDRCSACFATAAVSPVSAVMRARAETLDNTYLQDRRRPAGADRRPALAAPVRPRHRRRRAWRSCTRRA